MSDSNVKIKGLSSNTVTAGTTLQLAGTSNVLNGLNSRHSQSRAQSRGGAAGSKQSQTGLLNSGLGLAPHHSSFSKNYPGKNNFNS